jgi:hypothetical protein
MESKQSNFDPKVLLPKDKIINTAGTHLYRIGLSLFTNGFKKRNRFYNPMFIFLLSLSALIRALISLSIPDSEEFMFLIIGDFSYIFGLKTHWNLYIILLTLLAIISQIINYIDYKNKTKPLYLKPFKMMSGLISPQTIGFTEEKDVNKILRDSTILFNLCHLITDLIIPLGTIITVNTTFGLKCTLMQMIIFVFPHSLHYALYVHSVHNIIFWQLIYFHLICYYLKTKLKNLNEKLKTNAIMKSKNFNPLNIMKSLNSVYSEITEYDQKYWSKFLFLFWILFTLIINTFLYSALFGKLNIIVGLIFKLGIIMLICALLLVISTASSVNSEANKSYKLLNSSLFLIYRKRIKLSTRMKVCVKE